MLHYIIFCNTNALLKLTWQQKLNIAWIPKNSKQHEAIEVVLSNLLVFSFLSSLLSYSLTMMIDSSPRRLQTLMVVFFLKVHTSDFLTRVSQ